MNVKKIIAREGLIIIAFLLGSGIGIFSGLKMQQANARSTTYDEQQIVVEKLRELGTNDAEVLKKHAIKVTLANGFFDDDMPSRLTERANGISDEQIKKIRKALTVRRFFRRAGELIVEGSFVLLIAGYPLYLFICFILWAIKTLRTK